MQDYIIGFHKYREESGSRITSCSCGTVSLKYTSKCEGCGNTEFANLGTKKRAVHPYLEVIHKDRKGFKAKRTNLSVFHDDDYNVMVKPNMVQILIYDLVKKEMKLYKNGETIDLNSYDRDSHLSRFFTNVGDVEFRRMVSTTETSTLYEFAWKHLSKKGYNYYAERKIYRGLTKLLHEGGYMQILANAGFPNVSRFYESNGYARFDTLNKEGTTPSEILGVPKFILKHIRENEDVSLFDIKEIKKALQKVDGNRFRELLEIVRDESTIRELCQTLDRLIEIHDTYGYKNLKKLALYLFREIRMNQGIDSPSNGATLLRDYIRMSVRLNQEYEKYPKSLKKEHDVTQMNYKVQENELKKKEFVEAIQSEEYKSYEYKKKELSIITPKEMADLIKEGSELSHCIASYSQSIIDKSCKIFFLRRTEEIDKPFVSIEVRNQNIRQVRGYANRSSNQKERDFIKEWAQKKDLVEAYY